MNGTSSWKLGLFVLSGLVLLIGSAFYLGARRLVRPSAEVVSFFDESVQGLEEGAPLKMRGVTIGKVKAPARTSRSPSPSRSSRNSELFCM